MHNLHHNSNGNGAVDSEYSNIITRKLNLNLTCETTNKSMSLSHPSLTQTLSRSGKYLTAVDRSFSPLWSTLTTAQVITVDYVDEIES